MLNIDCVVFSGLALSNVIVDSCYAITEQVRIYVKDFLIAFRTSLELELSLVFLLIIPYTACL